MRYSLLSLPALALGITACSPDGVTNSGDAEMPRFSSATVSTGSWRTRAAYPTNLYEAESASLPDPATGRQTLYVVGGRGDPRKYNNVFRAVMAYDVSSNTWRPRARFPVRIFSANGAVAINGRIYVAGGITSYTDPVTGFWRARQLSSLYVYDPAADKWSRLKDLPYASSHGVSSTYGGQLYVAAFCQDVTVCGDGELLRYNPSTDRWSRLGRTPHSPAFAGGGFVNGKLYLVDMAGHVDIYDPATNRWSAGPKSPFPQSAFCPSASATLQAKLYLVGCHEPSDFSGVHPMLVFNPVSSLWSQSATPPIPALGHWWTLTRVFVNGKPGLELVGGEWPGNHAQFMP